MSNPENYPMEVINSIGKYEAKYQAKEFYSGFIFNSVNFCVEKDTFSMGKLKGLYGNEILNMPFDKICISFCIDGKSFCVACHQTKRPTKECQDFSIEIMTFKKVGNDWLPYVCIARLKKLNLTIDGTFDFEQVSLKNGEENPENHLEVTGFYCEVLLVLLEILTCSNVSHELIPRKKGLAGISAKNLALPAYESRRLVINANQKPGSKSNGTTAISSHASPREHLRRGHIRNLQDGRKIWVNSCVVGAASSGRIDKTYVVRNSAR